MKLIDMKVFDFLKEVDSDSPAPGGGSVSALAGALAASLARMVAHLTFGKKKYESLGEKEKDEFKKTFNMLKDIKEQLEKLVDEDTKAYTLVMSAYKLPKETEEEKKIRSIAIQDNLKAATQTPLKISKLSAEGLELMGTTLSFGNKNAVTDLGVAAHLFFTALEGGILNVKINLSSIDDEVFKKDILNEIDHLYRTASVKKEELLEAINLSI